MRENIFITVKIMANKEGPQAPPAKQGAEGTSGSTNSSST